MRRFIAALVVAVAAVVAVPAPAGADRGVDDQHQMLPLYVYPQWWNADNAWIEACANSNTSDTGSTMIANLGSDSAGNPGGGAGTAYNIDLGTVVAYCAELGHNVVGYVDTNYGTRPLAAVYADIDAWYSRYDGTTNIYDIGTTDDPDGETAQIGGVFLDQVSITPTAASVEPGSDVGTVCDLMRAHHAGSGAATPYTITPTATPWNFWAGAAYLAQIRAECG